MRNCGDNYRQWSYGTTDTLWLSLIWISTACNSYYSQNLVSSRYRGFTFYGLSRIHFVRHCKSLPLITPVSPYKPLYCPPHPLAHLHYHRVVIAAIARIKAIFATTLPFDWLLGCRLSLCSPIHWLYIQYWMRLTHCFIMLLFICALKARRAGASLILEISPV